MNKHIDTEQLKQSIDYLTHIYLQQLQQKD
jgi:hypothetical protein